MNLILLREEFLDKEKDKVSGLWLLSAVRFCFFRLQTKRIEEAFFNGRLCSSYFNVILDQHVHTKEIAVEVWNDLNTWAVRERLIYSYRTLAHFWLKSFGGFLPPITKDFLSYWRHGKTLRHIRRKYTYIKTTPPHYTSIVTHSQYTHKPQISSSFQLLCADTHTEQDYDNFGVFLCHLAFALLST